MHNNSAFGAQAALFNQADEERGYEPDAAAPTEAEHFLAPRAPESAQTMAIELWRARMDAAVLLEHRTGGAYSPDPVAATFPLPHPHRRALSS